jgi:hypothetical protein
MHGLAQHTCMLRPFASDLDRIFGDRKLNDFLYTDILAFCSFPAKPTVVPQCYMSIGLSSRIIRNNPSSIDTFLPFQTIVKRHRSNM